MSEDKSKAELHRESLLAEAIERVSAGSTPRKLDMPFCPEGRQRIDYAISVAEWKLLYNCPSCSKPLSVRTLKPSDVDKKYTAFVKRDNYLPQKTRFSDRPYGYFKEGYDNPCPACGGVMRYHTGYSAATHNVVPSSGVIPSTLVEPLTGVLEVEMVTEHELKYGGLFRVLGI
jgi:hypothetical protein